MGSILVTCNVHLVQTTLLPIPYPIFTENDTLQDIGALRNHINTLVEIHIEIRVRRV